MARVTLFSSEVLGDAVEPRLLADAIRLAREATDDRDR
jgi:hypothetical protein